ncbi:glycosyltransferase family 9 protein [Nitrospira sp. Nam74]
MQIAILRALQLGDLLCAVPAWRALRASFPSAHIAFVGLPWARQFATRFAHYLNEFIEFPGYPGLPEREYTSKSVPQFLVNMQRRDFDLALQMHGNGHYANALTALWGARMMAGFYVPGEFCPDAHSFIPYPDSIPEIHRHLRLMESIGVRSLGEDMEWPVTPADESALETLDAARSLKRRNYVCVHPGGRGSSRRWDPEYFAGIADVMTGRGFQVVITGTNEESGLAAAMIGAMRTTAVNMVGQTDLGMLGVLLRDAQLLIANDTGVSHVAAALRLPSVIICTGSDPVRWGPLDRQRHRMVMGANASIGTVVREIDDVLRADLLQTEVPAS